MPVSSYYQQKLGDSSAAVPTPETTTRVEGYPIGGATKVPTSTPAPKNTQGIKAFGNLSQFLGGGQYNIPEIPNTAIKSARATQATFAGRQQARGPYIGSNVGIDHIIPIALGGTDDPTNIQILPKPIFDKKTVVDDLAAFLYQKGKLQLGAARNLNKNWNNSPANMLDIPSLMKDPALNQTIKFADGTTFNIKDALKKIQSDPTYTQSVLANGAQTKVTPGSVMKNIGGIEGGLEKALNVGEGVIAAPFYGAIEGLLGHNPIKAAGQYFNDIQTGEAGLTGQPIFKSGLRAFTKQATFGYVNNNEPIQFKTPTETTVSKIVDAFAGAAGFVTSLEGMGTLFRAAGAGATGIGALDTALAQSRIPRMVESLSSTTLVKSLSASPLIKSMVETAGLFGVRGQIANQEPGQYFNLETRAKTLLGDLANGAFFGLTGGLLNMKLQGSSIPMNFTAGTLANTYLGYVVSKMQGANNEDALLNGAVFGVLHAKGLYDNLGKPLSEIQKTSANQGPLVGMKDFYENYHTLRGQQMAQQMASDYFKRFGYDGKVKTDTQIDAAVNHIKELLGQEVADGSMTHEQAGPLFQQAVLASRYLHLQNVPMKDQVLQQLRDIGSAFSTKSKQLAPTGHSIIDTTGQGSEFVNQIREANLPGTPVLDIHPALADRFMLTGMSSQLTATEIGGESSAIANRNQELIRASLRDPNNRVDFYLERKPDHPIDRNAVAAYAKVNDGPEQFIGYVPQESNIRNNQNQGRGASAGLFNPVTNKDTFAREMDQRGVTRVPMQLNREGELGPHGKGKVSREPWMIFNVPPESWGLASQIAEKNSVRSEVIPSPINRQEFFGSIPDSANKSLANAVFGKIEDNITLNNPQGLVDYLNSLGEVVSPEAKSQIENNLGQVKYGDILQLLGNTENMKGLNPNGEVTKNVLVSFLKDFLNVHGKEGLQKFLNAPISGQESSQSNAINIPHVPAPITETTTASTSVPETSVAATEQIMAKMPEEVQTNTLGKVKNIFLNQAVAQGTREVLPKDYNGFSDNNKLAGISKRVVNKIVDLLNSGISKSDPQIEKLFNFYDDLTREKMQKVAKGTVSFEEFLSHYVKKSDNVGIELFDPLLGRSTADSRYYDQYNNSQIQEFKRRYNILKQTADKGADLVVSPKGDKITDGVSLKGRSIIPKSPNSMFADQILNSSEAKAHIAKDGLPMIRQVRIATASDNNKAFAGNVTLKGSHPQQVEEIAHAMEPKDIFFLTNQNGVPTTAQGIYIAPEVQAEFVNRFDQNPETYSVTDPEVQQALKDLLPEEKNSSKSFKVMQVFFKDILKAGSNFDAAALFKRINLFDDQSIKWDEPGKVRVLFLPDTELKNIEAPGFTPPNFDRNDPRAQNFLAKTLEDGGRFQMPDLNKQIQFYMGNTSDSFNTKGTISMMLPDDQGLLAEKGNTGTLDPTTRILIERKYGITLQPNDIVSFQTNVKMGKKNLLTHPDNPDVKYYEVPKNNMRFLYEETKMDPESTFSLNGILGKFSKDDTVNVDGQELPIKSYLTSLFSPQAKLWVDTWNSVIKDGKNPVEALQENYAKDMEETGWGKLKIMAANKADIISLNRQFQNQMLRIFQDTVMRNRALEGAHLKLTPDLGFYDPNSNEHRYLKARQDVSQMGEAMISRQMAHNLGNPEFLMVARYPVTKKLALTKVKVLIGEEYGKNSLGMNNIVLNTHDVYINKEGDSDGDSVHIYKITPQQEADQLVAQGKPLNGIPEPVVDHIEQLRQKYIEQFGAEYGTQGIESNPYPKLPAASLEGRLYVAKKATEAKQSIGGISNASNMMNLFHDNMNDATVRQLFTVNGKYYEPRADFTVQDKVGQILQAAVDGTKSQAFSNLPAVEKNAFSHIFDTQDSKILAELWKNIRNSYSLGFGLGNKSFADVNGMLKNAKGFLTISPFDPNLAHPFQEVLSPFKDATENVTDRKEIWNSDVAAGETMKKELAAPAITPKAKQFIDFVTKDWLPKKLAAGKVKTAEAKQIRNGQPVLDYYYEHLDQFSKEDLQAISWFLTTDKAANQWYDPNFYQDNMKAGWWVERFDQLMLPEHAQAYYKARQAWYDINVIKKAPEAQNPPSEPPQTPTLPVVTPAASAIPTAPVPQLPSQQFPDIGSKLGAIK